MSYYITCPEDVDTLPYGTVVLIADGTARQKDPVWDWHESGGWISAGSDVADSFCDDDFPLRVIYNPDEDA